MIIEIDIPESSYDKMYSYCEGIREDFNTKVKEWLNSGYLMEVFGGVMVPVVNIPKEEVDPKRVLRGRTEVEVPTTQETQVQEPETKSEPESNPTEESTKEEQVKPKKQGITIHKK